MYWHPMVHGFQKCEKFLDVQKSDALKWFEVNVFQFYPWSSVWSPVKVQEWWYLYTVPRASLVIQAPASRLTPKYLHVNFVDLLL